MELKRIIYILVGSLSLGLGTLGTVLPILPTVPFLMLATFCFARSSKRVDQWFRSTSIYKNNLEDYVAGRGMTKKCKIRIMSMVSILMAIGFLMMGAKGIVVGCVVLSVVWVMHVIYFCFFVKTIPV